MTEPFGLTPAQLRRTTDPAALGFGTTEELSDQEAMVGQERAVAAVDFAIGMRRDGYNVFAMGPEGTGRYTLISQALRGRAALDPVPSDWCHVHNFADPQRPRALRLPPGRGARLRDDMTRLTSELRSAIPAAFEDERFGRRREALEEELKARRDGAFEELERGASQIGLALVRTPVGVALAPVREGQIINPEAFGRLPPEEQERLKGALEQMQEQLEAVLREVPRWERDLRLKVRELVGETVRTAVANLIEDVRRTYADLPEVVAYLNAAEIDIVDNADDFLAAAQAASAQVLPVRTIAPETPAFRRYQVNLMVDHGSTSGAPIVYEHNPTYPNLIGRIEYLAQLGALVTDYTLIKPGALHHATGGYLILDVRKVLGQPYAWDALKRALRAREVRIESLGQALSLISTVTLEPEPIPLDVKVALFGDRELYYLLCALDPDFLELFKVQADFDERVDRTLEAGLLFARLIGTLARREGIRAVEGAAVARLLDHAARLAGDSEKLSTHMRTLTDLLREADYYARDGDRPTLGAGDVQAAIDARIERASRIRERVQEEITRGTILIETDGSQLGQVNGLSVVQLGELSFGWPTRITARVQLGGGKVIDIEREVELGGPIHSKGVLILAGFLGGRYAAHRPLSLQASLVFEQSYSGVEGDSASLAELCALLSALAGIPVRQSLAVTGSVNQLGVVQAIGGVNEKIEGFFDVCAARGLTAEQGVLIPAANVKHLMLRADVVEAVAGGRFSVFAVETVDQALELLTGIDAGERDDSGTYPPGSVNGRVEARLGEMAERAREFASAARAPGKETPSEA